MAGMDDLFDDLDLDGIGDALVAEDDETARFSAKLLQRAKRSGTTTPMLSGRTMANSTRSADHVDDTTATAGLVARARARGLKAEGSQIAMDSIFQRAGLSNAENGFTVYRLEELFADEEIADLPMSARVSAIRAILKSHGVDVTQLFDDAVARRDALNEHDERLRQNIDRVEEQVLQENSTLQAEIEEFANPRLMRMEANEQRIERLRNDYERWQERQQEEQARILTILQPLGDDERLHEKPQVAAPGAKPAFALSGADVFDDPPGPARPAPIPSKAATAASGGWAMGEEPSSPRSVMVEQDLDVEYHSAGNPREELTGEFEFQRAPLRVPSTPIEGLLAGLAVIVWLIGGVLLTAQLVTDLMPAAAWGIGLGAPLGLALVMAVAFRRGNWWTGFFMMLLYLSLTAYVVAHYNPQSLIESLQQRPLQFVGDAGLPVEVDTALSNFTTKYASLLEGSLGLPPYQSPPPN